MTPTDIIEYTIHTHSHKHHTHNHNYYSTLVISTYLLIHYTPPFLVNIVDLGVCKFDINGKVRTLSGGSRFSQRPMPTAHCLGNPLSPATLAPPGHVGTPDPTNEEAFDSISSTVCLIRTYVIHMPPMNLPTRQMDTVGD